jgi:hypothetical protein
MSALSMCSEVMLCGNEGPMFRGMVSTDVHRHIFKLSQFENNVSIPTVSLHYFERLFITTFHSFM